MTDTTIKSKLPSNIQIGGEIINEGTMTINGEEMPKTDTTIKTTEGWRKKLDEDYIEYTDGGVWVRFTGKDDVEVDLDDFIQSLLTKQREQLIKEVEGIKESNISHIKECNLTGYKKSKWLWFNLGMDEVLNLLKQEK